MSRGKYDLLRPCVYGRETATGGCTCPGYKGGRKGVCVCGHERAWHKNSGVMPTVAAVPPEKLTWEQVVVALRLADDRIASLTKRVELLEGRPAHVSSGGGGGPPVLVMTDSKKPRPISRLLSTEPEPEPEQDDTDGDGLPRGERRVLTAVAQSGSGTGASRSFISQMTGYKSRSITNYVTRLRSKGYVSAGWPVFASPSGFTALGPGYAPLPTGHALLTYWMSRLGAGENRLLEVYVTAYPHPVSHEQVRSATGYAQRSITNYATRLLSRRLITKIGHSRRASDLLFNNAKPMPETA